MEERTTAEETAEEDQAEILGLINNLEGIKFFLTSNIGVLTSK